SPMLSEQISVTIPCMPGPDSNRAARSNPSSGLLGNAMAGAAKNVAASAASAQLFTRIGILTGTVVANQRMPVAERSNSGANAAVMYRSVGLGIGTKQWKTTTATKSAA